MFFERHAEKKEKIEKTDLLLQAHKLLGSWDNRLDTGKRDAKEEAFKKFCNQNADAMTPIINLEFNIYNNQFTKSTLYVSCVNHDIWYEQSTLLKFMLELFPNMEISLYQALLYDVHNFEVLKFLAGRPEFPLDYALRSMFHLSSTQEEILMAIAPPISLFKTDENRDLSKRLYVGLDYEESVKKRAMTLEYIKNPIQTREVLRKKHGFDFLGMNDVK